MKWNKSLKIKLHECKQPKKWPFIDFDTCTQPVDLTYVCICLTEVSICEIYLLLKPKTKKCNVILSSFRLFPVLIPVFTDQKTKPLFQVLICKSQQVYVSETDLFNASGINHGKAKRNV